MLAWTTTSLLDAASRTIAERGVLMWLEPLHQRQGGYLKTLAAYNGELDTDKGRAEFFNLMQGGAPAILVQSGDKRGDAMSPRRVERKEFIEIEVVLVSNHSRDMVSMNQGDQASIGNTTNDPGIYQMFDDVDLILMGRTPGASKFGRYFPAFEGVLFQIKGQMTAWRRRYEIEYSNSGKTDQELQDDGVFDSILARHNLFNETGEVTPTTVNPVAEALTE